MKMKSLKILLCVTLTVSSFWGNYTTYAKAFTNSTQVLNNSDLNKVKSNINKVLSSKYEVMKTWKVSNLNDVINNSALLDLINKHNTFDASWYKKFNFKINSYNPSVNIDSISKTSSNTYVLNITYDVTFRVNTSNSDSRADDKKIVEIKFENNNWYITKLLDVDKYNNSSSSKNYKKVNNLIKADNTVNVIESSDYTNEINSETNDINDMSSNIDEYYNNVRDYCISSKNTKNDIVTSKQQILKASNYSGYNSAAAVDYAHRYAISPNPWYRYYEDDDCTNFASQIVNAGGVPTTWTWYSSMPTRLSPAWYCVVPFFDYMVSNGYASAPDGGCRHAQLGDILQLSRNPGTWTHTIIVTKIDSNYMYYSAHSVSRYDEPVITAFTEKNYKFIRLLKFWH
ncbi:amidase domain-containing protein [Clostridium felsineum]|uniref:amidase domain-containing protein n=1 Tax=Clostridium felsineum TaxID=36839 RepID=UPI00098C32AA|nr:amidase domain-containing protein [Clostridium felsineum]URZ16356.1 hypothetical protein CLFE_024030 [Clostridium felsineum DSM 794]